MKQDILASVQDAVHAIEFLKLASSLQFIEQAAVAISRCFGAAGKILLAGNGGSLCDAMHFAEELTGFYRQKRPALPALALSDPSHMSCVANDVGYDQVFSRGVEALGKPEDIFIVMTTSGNSSNLVKAVSTAKEKGLYTIGFLGKSGGLLKGQCDLEWIVNGFLYSDRIQEAHMAAIHIVIEQLEKMLFSKQSECKQSIDFCCHGH